MNKKIVTIMLTLTLCTTLMPTTVEAKLFNITSPGKETTTNTTDKTGVNIIKHLGIKIDSAAGNVTSVGESGVSGDSTQGSNGMSVAFAYLTPQKQFGLITRNDLNISSGNGTNKSVSDPLGVWSKAKTQTSDIKKFYDNAVSDFTNNASIKSSVNSVTKEDIASNKVLTQVSDANNEFVATTLYVRWFYDVMSGRTSTDQMYMRQLPVLEFYSGSSGPYVGWGDYFSSTMRVIPGKIYSESNYQENVTRRKKISNNASKYLRGLNAITGKTYSGTYLTSDPYYGGKTSVQSYNSNNKALFEKSFEYRRYFNRGSSGNNGNSGDDYYEIVYPVTSYTTVTNKSEATKGLEASVKSNTVFTDDTKTQVEKYEFKVDIKPFEAVTKGVESLESPKEYTILHDKNSSTIPSSPSTEPSESKADVWHEIISKKLFIKKKDGTVVKEVDLKNNNETVTIYPKDVNYENLGGCVVSIEIKYKTLSRYMQQKEVYTYSYNWDNGAGKVTNYNYSTLQQELNKKGSSLIQGALTQIQEYNNKLEPQSKYVYVTAGLDDKPQTKTASDVIVGPEGADPVSLDLTVNVNPPNALTVLEGGMFDINLSFDPKEVSIGKQTEETRVWFEDLKITPIVVKAQNGDIIYKNTTPITDITNDKLNTSIMGVTAKPSHIGKATVTVYYTYTLVEEVYNRDDKVDEFGNVTEGEEYLVRTDRTECKGSAKGYFNIYSLTGVTSN